MTNTLVTIWIYLFNALPYFAALNFILSIIILYLQITNKK